MHRVMHPHIFPEKGNMFSYFYYYGLLRDTRPFDYSNQREAEEAFYNRRYYEPGTVAKSLKRACRAIRRGMHSGTKAHKVQAA